MGANLRLVEARWVQGPVVTLARVRKVPSSARKAGPPASWGYPPVERSRDWGSVLSACRTESLLLDPGEASGGRCQASRGRRDLADTA
ncbi:hypothetical protein GCM10010304_38160 [Streptomyces roseoviolaceus]